MHDSFFGSHSVAAMSSHYNGFHPQTHAANNTGEPPPQPMFANGVCGYPTTLAESQAQWSSPLLTDGHSSSFSDAPLPIHNLLASPCTSISSQSHNASNGASHIAAPIAQFAASQPPSHTNGLRMGSSGSDLYNNSSPSLSTTTTRIPAFTDLGSDPGFTNCKNMWSSIIQQNKQIIEAWQARLLAQSHFFDNSSSSTTGSLSTHIPSTSDSEETDRKSKSSSSRNDSDSNSGSTDGGTHRSSRKGKSKRTAASSSDGTKGSSGGSGGGSSGGSGVGSSGGSGAGSGAEVSPDNSDATSSSSQSRHKKKRKDKTKKTKSKKGKEPKKKQVNLFPRKKKAEEHRTRDHMIISLNRLKPLFHLPLKQAATKLGICTTALKSVCRKFGLKRWPYKLLKQVGMNDECLALMLAKAKETGRPAPSHGPGGAD